MKLYILGLRRRPLEFYWPTKPSLKIIRGIACIILWSAALMATAQVFLPAAGTPGRQCFCRRTIRSATVCWPNKNLLGGAAEERHLVSVRKIDRHLWQAG